MIGAYQVLALIPARGGSKGLPGKNILPVGGRPLLAFSIAAAQGARCIDRTVLSSDNEAIMAAAKDHGCDVPFRRPAHLATDGTSPILQTDVFHAIDIDPLETRTGGGRGRGATQNGSPQRGK